MHRPLIAILLDACEPAWLEYWLAAGDLPVLAGLRDERALRITGSSPVSAGMAGAEPTGRIFPAYSASIASGTIWKRS
jgi:hypothetical protein